jgi:hypothetical protein
MTATQKSVAAAAVVVLALSSARSPALFGPVLHAGSAAESERELQVSVNLCTDLISGWRLSSGESLFSALGGFRLVMQHDGNLVLYAIDDMKLPADVSHVFACTPDVMKLYAKPIWSTGTHVPKEGKGRGSYSEMSEDGNFVVCDQAGRPVFETGTRGHPGSLLRLQTDGNLVVYTHDMKPAWSSNTAARPVIREAVTPAQAAPGRVMRPDRGIAARFSRDLRPGWRLNPGDSLFSPLGGFRLVFQHDGNLVLYVIDDTRIPGDSAQIVWHSLDLMEIYQDTIWSTKTHAAGPSAGVAAYCMMKDDGNFVILDEDDKMCFQTGTQGNPGAFLRCQDDGNLVIYTRQNKAIWQSKTYARVDDIPVAK